MKRLLTHIAIVIAIGMLTMPTAAQTVAANDSTATSRTITPVRPVTNTTLTPPRGTDEDVIERYLAGDTTSIDERERQDSLKKVYPRYPKLTDISFGVNIGDQVARLLGQRYGGIDVSATLNMWNRLQPVVELGFGWVNERKEELHYTYKTKFAPYIKIGANYNFFFKKEPKYQLIAGLRLGATTFKYDITDISVSSPYWQQTANAEMRGLSSSAIYGEILAGIKVHLWRQWSMGWQLRWHTVLACKKSENAKPWYIPGLGDRERHWQMNISIYFTLPLSRDKWPAIDPKPAPTKNK